MERVSCNLKVFKVVNRRCVLLHGTAVFIKTTEEKSSSFSLYVYLNDLMDNVIRSRVQI